MKDIIEQNSENISYWKKIQKSFSRLLRDRFSHKVVKLSESLHYEDIFEVLQNNDITINEKKKFINNLQEINLINIVPILENRSIEKFHLFFIEKLENIELTVKTVFGQKIPENTDFINLVNNPQIPMPSVNSILRLKNTRKYPIDELLSYVNVIKAFSTKAYLLNRFLEEQNLDDVREILGNLDGKNDFIGVEIIMQIPGLLPFKKIRNFLENPKISFLIIQYLTWKCENNLDKDEVLQFIYQNDHLTQSAIHNLVQKIPAQLSLEEWWEVVEKYNETIGVEVFMLLKKNISDMEVEEFLRDKACGDNFLKKLFPYREKNFKNIFAEQKRQGIEPKITPAMILGNSTKNSADMGFLQRHMTSTDVLGSDILTIFSVKMQQQPDKNIYDFYREMSTKYLYKLPVVSEVERAVNNKKITEYQKRFLSVIEINKAQNLGIDINQFDLTVYIRYEHQVDFPEIAELITVFIDAYVDGGYSKYFSNIRIVPRNALKETNIHPFLNSLKKAQYFNVLGIDAPVALHTLSSCIYLSHSANAGRNNIPNIISASMRSKENDIHSFLELEAIKNSQEDLQTLKNISVLEIFSELIKNLQNLENQLDKLIDNKNP